MVSMSPTSRKIFLSNFSVPEPYFDGKDVTTRYRNPWKERIPLNGTDAFSFNPVFSKSDNPWIYLDDLFRTSPFQYYNSTSYTNLNVLRFM